VDAVKDLPPKVSEVLSSVGSFIPSKGDLAVFNSDWQKAHLDSASHLQSAYKIRYLVDPSTKAANEKDVQKLLGLSSITLDEARAGLDCLDEWESEEAAKDAYKAAALEKWPHATVFKK
jgi:hypothetical protein